MENQGNILMNKYDVGRLLGQGTFGKVYYARDLKAGQCVAIKVMDKDKVINAGLVDQTKREISAMGLVKHQNVMQLYEVMATKTKIYFVMEYAKGGELYQKVAKGRLKEQAARKYFQQLVRAVNFCHSRGVYHRDLKPENLLLDEEGNLKVTDFGLSALLESTRLDGLLHTACGTPAYAAPEVISRRGYDGAKADVWSCGVVLFVLLAGYTPFRDINLMGMYRKITKGEYSCPNWFSPKVKRLLSRTLDPNPNQRISMNMIMESSWFRHGLDLEDSKHASPKVEDFEKCTLNIDSIFHASTSDNTAGTEHEVAKVYNLNAFNIISLSAGFDLSGLFVSHDQKDEVHFISTKPTSAITSKMEEIASNMKLEMTKNDDLGSSLTLKWSNKRYDSNFSIDVEIFEISPSLHLVEVKKSGGDSMEYQRMLKTEIRPALGEIVWAWHGELRQG